VPTVKHCSGYTGSVCSACSAGYRLLNNQCTPCNSNDNFGAGCLTCNSNVCLTCDTNFYKLPDSSACGIESANCAAPNSQTISYWNDFIKKDDYRCDCAVGYAWSDYDWECVKCD